MRDSVFYFFVFSNFLYLTYSGLIESARLRRQPLQLCSFSLVRFFRVDDMRQQATLRLRSGQVAAATKVRNAGSTGMIQVTRERHETPASVARRLRLAGGANRYGEANYRAIWGWNRLGWIGGKFEDRDAAGKLLREVVELRWEPKYPKVNRWHVERWVPPEAYGSPRTWYAQTMERADGVSVAALGPYPARGEYEHCFTLQGPRGEFVQLTSTIVEQVSRAIEWSRGQGRAMQRAKLYEREERRERAYEEWAFDMMGDAAPAMHGVPFVAVG